MWLILGFYVKLQTVKIPLASRHSSPCPPPSQVGSRGTFPVQVQPAGQRQRSSGEVVAEKTHRGLLPPRGPGRTQGLLQVPELAPPTHSRERAGGEVMPDEGIRVKSEPRGGPVGGERSAQVIVGTLLPVWNVGSNDQGRELLHKTWKVLGSDVILFKVSLTE